MRYLLVALSASLLGSPAPLAQCELDRVAPPDLAQGDVFGGAVSVSGSTLVVGAPGHELHGAAYVFEELAGSWVQVSALTPPAEAGSIEFGHSVAVSGTTALVGAPRADSTGAVFVYERAGGEWIETGKLVGAGTLGGDRFGHSVDLDGDRAIVGAPRSDASGSWSGAAFVFDRSGGVWTESATLLGSGGSTGDELGSAVAVSGDVAVVGAPSDGTTGTAYVFTGAGWPEVAALVPSNGTAQSVFGESVAVDGTVAVVGDSRGACPDGGSACGAAYVFEDSGGAWVETAVLASSDSSAHDELGRSVDVRGGLVVVGATRGDGYHEDAGAAYVFEDAGGGWTETARLMSGSTEGLDRFGQSVSTDGVAVAVGAPFDDGAAVHDLGSAYVWNDAAGACSLFAWTQEISLGAGGTQVLDLDAGPAFAGAVYLVLGSASTTNGIDLGGAVLPLDVDAYFFISLKYPNVPPFADTLSTLDAQGRAQASITFQSGMNPTLAGSTLYHAYLVITYQGIVPSVALTSNAVPVELVL